MKMWFVPLVEGFAMEFSFADRQLLFIAENKGEIHVILLV